MTENTSAVQNKSPGDPRLVVFCEVVADDFAMLARFHDKEPEKVLLATLKQQNFPQGLGLSLESDLGVHAFELMEKAVASLPSSPDPDLMDDLAADYASIYLTYGIQASPEESVWIDEEHLACQQSMFQVRQWYNDYGLEVPDWRQRPDDHLVYQLQFIEHLCRRYANAEGLKALARFMDDHLLRWIISFSERVSSRCGTAYFAGVAMLTSAYSNEVRDLLAEIIGEARPTAEEVEQRMKPAAQREEAPLQYMPGVGPAV